MTPVRTRTFTTANAAAVANALANRFLIPLLNSSAGGRLGRRLAVIEYLGRRTGQHHQLVALYAAEGQTVRITVGMAEHKTWWRNFEAPHPLRLRLAGVDYKAVAHVVPDRHQMTVVAELVPPQAPATGNMSASHACRGV
jgi:hypothetical protein